MNIILGIEIILKLLVFEIKMFVMYKYDRIKVLIYV